MKIKTVINMVIALTSVIFFMAGGISFADQKSEDGTTLKEVRQEVKEVVEAMENYSAAQRADALEKVRVAMNDMDSRIADLEARVEKNWEQMDQAARDKAGATLKSLKKKRNELAEWYGGLQYSSVNAWQHVKKGFLESYEALSRSYDKAVKEF
ncbi:MAG: hypothetical protein AVO38_05895 [delta proteobacterium ML8_D]|jgi:methyl-accepting chemotaxis protein|nr:MAG: hypothetical protein AVO38_05895 [delta proteobacterium ML8_D]